MALEYHSSVSDEPITMEGKIIGTIHKSQYKDNYIIYSASCNLNQNWMNWIDHNIAYTKSKNKFFKNFSQNSVTYNDKQYVTSTCKKITMWLKYNEFPKFDNIDFSENSVSWSYKIKSNHNNVHQKQIMINNIIKIYNLNTEFSATSMNDIEKYIRKVQNKLLMHNLNSNSL